MTLSIELDREEDGRWIAEVTSLSGVMVYGQTREEAIAGVEALVVRVLTERLEKGGKVPALHDLCLVVE